MLLADPLPVADVERPADLLALRSFAFDRLGAIAAILDDTGTIVDTNAGWRLFTHLNDGAPERTGRGVDYLASCDRAAANGSSHASDAAAGLRQILAGERDHFDLEYPCPSPTEDRWFMLQAASAPVADGGGVVLFHVDISARKLREIELTTQAEYDDLTGLPNRRAVTSFIQRHLTSVDEPLWLLFVDLDGFKAVNDTYGHHVGDELLVKVAARARRTVRQGDLLCRLSGDEFVLACPGIGDDRASEIATRLRDVMAEPFQVGAAQVRIGASVGVASSDPTSTVASLLSSADSAMYLDKRTHVGRPITPSDQLPPEPALQPTARPGQRSTGRASLLSELQTAKATSNAIVARSRDLVMFFEADGTIVWASPAASELHGWLPEDLVGRSGLEMIHPDDQERVLLDFLTIPKLGDHVHTEFRILDRAGNVRWLDEIATNMIDDPNVGVIVGNLRDVTDRKHAEESVRVQAGLLAAVGQPVIASDPEDRVIYWNEAAESTYGWTSDEALGTKLGELLPVADGWDGAADAMRSRVHDDQAWSGEFCLQAKDGTRIPIMATTTPMFDDQGQRIATIGVSTDITDRLRGEESAARLAAIVESSSDAILSTSLDGIITTWNAGAERLYGRSADEVIGEHIRLVVTHEHDEEARGALVRVARGEAIAPYETTHRRRDGTEFHAPISLSPIRSAAGSIVGVAAVTRDVSDRVEVLRRWEDDRRRLAEAQRSAHLGSLEWNRRTGEATWSDELYDILGLDHDVAPGDASFTARVHPDDLDASTATLLEVLAGTFGDDLTYRIVRPDGEVRWIRTRYSPVDGWPDLVGCTVFDVTERREASLALEHLADNDPLTGLPNRRLLTTRLDATLAAVGEDDQVAVALLGLDQFQKINDSLGPAAGDTMLTAVARRLEAALLPSETLARFGGDEFAVVGADAARTADAEDLVRRLLAAFDAPFTIGAREFHMSASIGSILSRPDDDADTLLRDVDAAVHRAKESGRARAVHFDETFQIRNRRRLELETELRAALDREQLHVVYQPVVRLADLRTAGFEALLRWTHPVLGVISPEEFMPIAEATGLIVPIGDWVLRQAVDQAAAWRHDDPASPIWVAVNLSARQLERPELVDEVIDALAGSSIPVAALHLEVTESILVEDIEHSLQTITALHDLGITISIDDFGTGYSSLSYLKRLPIDTLKIDRSFVNGLGTVPDDTSIVRTIVSLADTLDLEVIAEGVEDETQLRALKELACTYGQGFLWSAGIGPDQALRRITAEAGQAPADGGGTVAG